jgi:hypothetical protein
MNKDDNSNSNSKGQRVDWVRRMERKEGEKKVKEDADSYENCLGNHDSGEWIE